MRKNRSNRREINIPSKEEVAREREKLRYRMRFQRTLFSTVGFLIVVAAISVLISTMLFPVIQVTGDSMEPTVENGEILILQKTDELKPGIWWRFIIRAGSCLSESSEQRGII